MTENQKEKFQRTIEGIKGKEGNNHDFGILDSPNESSTQSSLKQWIYRNIGHKIMNCNVNPIRKAISDDQ